MSEQVKAYQYLTLTEAEARACGFDTITSPDEAYAYVPAVQNHEVVDYFSWFDNLEASLKRTKPPENFRRRIAEGTLEGRPIYLDLAIDSHRDEVFLDYLETLRTLGVGVVVWLDFLQDDYTCEPRDGPGIDDAGFHYAVLGPDITGLKDNAPAISWLEENGYLADPNTEKLLNLGGLVIPLPMLAERLGYATLDATSINSMDREEVVFCEKTGRWPTRINISFGDFLHELKTMFNGRVRLGLRPERDALYHFHRREKIPREWADIEQAFSEPLVPTDGDDEERLAEIQAWLLKLAQESPDIALRLSDARWFLDVVAGAT